MSHPFHDDAQLEAQCQDVISDISLVPCPAIAILTGAGVSAESGLSTFRGQGGLWAGHRVEDVATPQAFQRDPALVHAFYNERRRALKAPGVTFNSAHEALAKLEAVWPESVTFITQNVDDLHERAGSTRVIHMHGELMKIRHQDTGEIRLWHDDCDGDTLDGRWRPHIVWFGEAILEPDAIMQALSQAGLFLCIGTAGQVYPAAGFVHEVSGPGIEFNLSVTAVTPSFQHAIHAPASKSVAAFVECLLAASVR